MSPGELDEAMKKVSDLVHNVYQNSNEGPRLLNQLFREYPETRQLRRAATNRHGASGELSGVPATRNV
jgi:transcriptional regulator of aromatic amino acid metabolism